MSDDERKDTSKSMWASIITAIIMAVKTIIDIVLN